MSCASNSITVYLDSALYLYFRIFVITACAISSVFTVGAIVALLLVSNCLAVHRCFVKTMFSLDLGDIFHVGHCVWSLF